MPVAQKSYEAQNQYTQSLMTLFFTFRFHFSPPAHRTIYSKLDCVMPSPTLNCAAETWKMDPHGEVMINLETLYSEDGTSIIWPKVKDHLL